MATKQPKPVRAGTDTPPEELPPELRGTIFDSSHVERGEHLQSDKVDEVFATEPRIKENNVATPTKPAKGTKTNGKAPAKAATKATAAPFDRVKASAKWAKDSPCEAATGPKRDPRPCKGVGVVKRETIKGKTIEVCAAHVLATEVATVAERQAANKEREAAKVAKAAPKAKAAAPKAAAAKAPAKTAGKTKKVDLTARA